MNVISSPVPRTASARDGAAMGSAGPRRRGAGARSAQRRPARGRGGKLPCKRRKVLVQHATSACRRIASTRRCGDAQFGRIDTLVNNAGVSAQALFAEVNDLGWTEQLMRVNHWGSVWCTHAALEPLKASRGRIVAVSSLCGLAGVRAHGLLRQQVRDDRLLRGAADRAGRRRRQRDHRLPGRGGNPAAPSRLECPPARSPAAAGSTNATR